MEIINLHQMTKQEILEEILDNWAKDVYSHGIWTLQHKHKLYEDRLTEAKKILEAYIKASE